MFCEKWDAFLVLNKVKGSKETIITRSIVCIDCGLEFANDNDVKGFMIKQEIEHGVEAFIEIVEFKEHEDKITEDMREELRERYREILT